MEQYIDKSALVAEIKKLKMDIGNIFNEYDEGFWEGRAAAFDDVICAISSLEVKDQYKQCIQYPSVKDGIKAHAETYSFNIESKLFNQLTKEQQALWRKEIEQACISGGEVGVELARDPRYKENHEVKEVDLEKEIELVKGDYEQVDVAWNNDFDYIARHFFELGLKVKQESNDDVKIGEAQIYLEDDGGEPPYDGKQWLDLSCTEYEIPKALFKDGDNVEILIRKAQKGE